MDEEKRLEMDSVFADPFEDAKHPLARLEHIEDCVGRMDIYLEDVAKNITGIPFALGVIAILLAAIVVELWFGLGLSWGMLAG